MRHGVALFYKKGCDYIKKSTAIKVVFFIIFSILVLVLAVPLSYAADYALANKVAEFKFVDVQTCIDGLINNQKQLQLYLIVSGFLLIIPILIVVLFGHSYKADKIEITPDIFIPAPAGEGQNGTARFMTEKEKKKNFAVWRFDKSSGLYKALNKNGDIYFSSAEKDVYQKGKVIANIKKAPKKGGLVIGRKLVGDDELIYYVDDDYHSLIFGATGSGKSRTLVLQSITFTAMAGEGIVVNDPKGEIYYYTHRVLESLGYEVVVMDLQNPEKSMGKNLLQPIIDAVNRDEMNKAQSATWDLIESIVAKNDKGEPIWTNGEKAIIGACVLAVVYDNKDKPQYQNLTNVYYFLANMVKADSMNKTPLEAYIAKLPDTHPAKALLGITDVAPSRTRASFYTSALTSLRLFSTSDIASITSTSEFDYLDIARKKQALFYILPDQKTAYYPIVTMLVNQQYEVLVDYAKENGNRLPKRVNFFLDEFGNFTAIADIQAKLTVARGYGIRFNLFIQDEAQLKDKYDENVAKIIMGNCSVWVYLASAGKETRDMISSKLGKYTTLKYSSSGNKQRYSNPSTGYSSQLEGRDLLTADELDRIARPYQLVMTIGKYPAMMISPDLSKWSFNHIMGLGDKEHNKRFIQVVTNQRKVIRDANKPPEIWQPWKPPQQSFRRSETFEYRDESDNELEKVTVSDFFVGDKPKKKKSYLFTED